MFDPAIASDVGRLQICGDDRLRHECVSGRGVLRLPILHVGAGDVRHGNADDHASFHHENGASVGCL